MKILVSACLLGENVKYNGGNNYHEKLSEMLKGHEVIPVCPEVMGGLPVPRKPAEIVNGIVRNEDGTTVDAEFRLGADRAAEIAERENIDIAVLKSRSPSCGAGTIYDGSFSHTQVPGDGIFAALLKEKGFRVIDETDLPESFV